MKNSVIYIVGATVLGGGAYLFLKNKKAKDLAKLDEIGGTTPSGATPSATTPSGATPSGITPNISEPVKIDKDVNLDAYNIQLTLDGLKKLADELKNQPRKTSATGVTTKEWYDWYFRVGKPSVYAQRRGVLIERLAKLGYKFDNGLLIKI
jgi:hypothetical protein